MSASGPQFRAIAIDRVQLAVTIKYDIRDDTVVFAREIPAAAFIESSFMGDITLEIHYGSYYSSIIKARLNLFDPR